MSDVKPVRLESGRLQLRSAVKGDAELLFAGYFGSVESSRFLSRKPYTSVEQTNAFLKKWTQEAWHTPGVPFAWVIAKLESLEPVGIFLVFPKGDVVEIHYGISENHRGQGFASVTACAE